MNISLCVQQYRLIFEMCTLSPLALKRKKLLLHLLSVCVLFKSLFSFPSCFSHKNIHSQWQESQSFLSAFSYIFLFNSMLSVPPPPPPPLQSALLLRSRFVPSTSHRAISSSILWCIYYRCLVRKCLCKVGVKVTCLGIGPFNSNPTIPRMLAHSALFMELFHHVFLHAFYRGLPLRSVAPMKHLNNLLPPVCLATL